MDREQAENYLVYAFSMFDRKKKGYINTDDLKEVFSILGETVSDDEVNSKVFGLTGNSDDQNSGGEVERQDQLQGVRRFLLQGRLTL